MTALKPRKCAAPRCRKSFQPRSALQRACSPSCALAYTQGRRAAKERRESRKWTRVQKEAIKTKPMLLKEAQRAFNAYIRARDADQPCISCGRYPKLDPLTGGSMDCGHYRSTGAAPELRFDEDNAHGQCKHCNRHLSGNVVGYRIGLVNRIGKKRVEILESDLRPRPRTRDEIRYIRDHYRAKAKELKRQHAA